MSKELNYTKAFDELQQIVADIEEKVKRASALIQICKTKLTSTEEDVNQILAELENDSE
jgi:exodeoxyribonuclease VII small subunit